MTLTQMSLSNLNTKKGFCNKIGNQNNSKWNVSEFYNDYPTKNRNSTNLTRKIRLLFPAYYLVEYGFIIDLLLKNKSESYYKQWRLETEVDKMVTSNKNLLQ